MTLKRRLIRSGSAGEVRISFWMFLEMDSLSSHLCHRWQVAFGLIPTSAERPRRAARPPWPRAFEQVLTGAIKTGCWRRRRVAGALRSGRPNIQTFDWSKPSTDPDPRLIQTFDRSKPSTLPDPQLIQTFYCSTTTTNVDPQLIQTLSRSKPSTDPDLQLIQTFYCSRPFTVPDLLLFQTLNWTKPSTYPNPQLFPTFYCSRPSPDQDSVVGFSPRIARRSRSWYRQIFAMPEFKGRCVLACLAKNSISYFFINRCLQLVSTYLSAMLQWIKTDMKLIYCQDP